MSMVTDGDYTYSGEHRVIYRSVESPWCAPEINIVCQLYFNTKNFIECIQNIGMACKL